MPSLSWCQGTPCRKSHRPVQEQLFEIFQTQLSYTDALNSAFSSMSWRPFFTLNKVPCNASAWHLLPFLAIEVHSYKSGVLSNLSAELHQMKQFNCHTEPTEGRNAFAKCIQMLSLSLQSGLNHKLMQKKTSSRVPGWLEEDRYMTNIKRYVSSSSAQAALFHRRLAICSQRTTPISVPIELDGSGGVTMSHQSHQSLHINQVSLTVEVLLWPGPMVSWKAMARCLAGVTRGSREGKLLMLTDSRLRKRDRAT